jgi:hypothetical protein
MKTKETSECTCSSKQFMDVYCPLHGVNVDINKKVKHWWDRLSHRDRGYILIRYGSDDKIDFEDINVLIPIYYAQAEGLKQELVVSEIAMEWWQTLTSDEKLHFISLYKTDDIIDIWRKEVFAKKVKEMKELQELQEDRKKFVEKNNKKLFSRFDPIIFEAYYNKFSEEGKLDMFEWIYRKNKKWDGINNAHPFLVDIARAFNAGRQEQTKQFKDHEKGIAHKFMSSQEYFETEFGPFNK